MPIVNGIITAPVSIEDVRKALGENSTDIGTLCKSDKVNIAARFKPIPIPSISSMHSPKPLTIADRNKAGNGVQLFYDPATNPTMAQWVRTMLNEGVPIEQMSVKKYEWKDVSNPYFRLVDFIDVDASGKPTGKGYKHDARIHAVTYSNGSEIQSMGGRVFNENPFNVPSGSAFSVSIPDDERYLQAWLDDTGFWTENDDDPNSLTIPDAINNPISGSIGVFNDLTKFSKRGVAIYMYTKTTSLQDESWVWFGYVVNKTSVGKWTDDMCFPSINLNSTVANGADGVVARKSTDGYINDNTSYPYATWSDLQGRCAVIEFYTSTTMGADMPIPGYGYEINIVRQPAGYETLDIENVVRFIIPYSGGDRLNNIANEGYQFSVEFYEDQPHSFAEFRTKMSGIFEELVIYVSSNNEGTNPVTQQVNILTSTDGDWSSSYMGGYYLNDLIYPPTSDVDGSRLGYLTIRGKKKGSSVYAYKVSSEYWRY